MRVYEILKVASKVGTWWVVLLFFVLGFLIGDIVSLASIAWGIMAALLGFVLIYPVWERAKQKVEEAYLQMDYTLKELEEDN